MDDGSGALLRPGNINILNGDSERLLTLQFPRNEAQDLRSDVMGCIARALQSSVDRRMQQDDNPFFFSVAEVDYDDRHVELQVGDKTFVIAWKCFDTTSENILNELWGRRCGHGGKYSAKYGFACMDRIGDAALFAASTEDPEMLMRMQDCYRVLGYGGTNVLFAYREF